MSDTQKFLVWPYSIVLFVFFTILSGCQGNFLNNQTADAANTSTDDQLGRPDDVEQRLLITAADEDIQAEAIPLSQPDQHQQQPIKPFDPDNIELQGGQVESMWIDPDFLKSLQ